MKTITNFLAIAALGAALFSGCRKDDNAIGVANAMDNTTSTTGAGLTYRLQAILPPRNAPLQWTSAYANTSNLYFNGIQLCGNAVKVAKYEQNLRQGVDLLANDFSGTIGIPVGKYANVTFGIGLSNPANLTAGSTMPIDQSTCLLLTGIFYNNNTLHARGVSVRVYITGPLVLSSQTVNNLLLANPINYNTAMYLNLGQATNGITAGMLASATVTDGAIVITNSSNNSLYTVIFNNLQNNLMAVQFPNGTSNSPLSMSY